MTINYRVWRKHKPKKLQVLTRLGVKGWRGRSSGFLDWEVYFLFLKYSPWLLCGKRMGVEVRHEVGRLVRHLQLPGERWRLGWQPWIMQGRRVGTAACERGLRNAVQLSRGLCSGQGSESSSPQPVRGPRDVSGAYGSLWHLRRVPTW